MTEDIVVPEILIAKYQKMFRILESWEIFPVTDITTGYANQITIDIDKKRASIYPRSITIPMEEYILHELLHIVLQASSSYEDEELSVQDICMLVKAAQQQSLA